MVISAAAVSDRALLSWQCHTVPAEDESSDESTNKYADDEVPVEIHGEQHDDVGDGELSHVQECPDKLLEEVWCEGLRLEKRRG